MKGRSDARSWGSVPVVDRAAVLQDGQARHFGGAWGYMTGPSGLL